MMPFQWTMRWMVAALLPLAAGMMSTRGQDARVRADWDPECRVPVVRVSAGDAGVSELWTIRAGAVLEDMENWPVVLEVRPDGQEHHWHDAASRADRRRFFRMERQPVVDRGGVPNFRLTDHEGRAWELFREGEARFIVLMVVDNAVLAREWDVLAPIVAAYRPRDVVFKLLNPVDEREAIRETVAALGVDIPVLEDPARLVTRALQLSRMGEVVVLDNVGLRPLYRGPAASTATTPSGERRGAVYLDAVLERHLDGESSFWERVEAEGEAPVPPPPGVPDYATEVGLLLRDRCATCHKPGGIGTWAMNGHPTIAARAADIRVQLLEGLMPPWHADREHQRFANDFSLMPDEQERLLAWLDAGAPRGEGVDPLAALPPPDAEWPMGTPDVILTIPQQDVPAAGEIDYRYLTINNPYNADVWLRAAVVQPGDATVVHHCLVFYGRNLMDILEVRGGLGGFFAGYVPGMEQVPYPEGTAKRLPAGGFFVFQMHYTASGTATSDQTRLGLYLATAPPEIQLETTAAYTTDIRIPANSRAYSLQAERVFDREVVLYEMSPHMHYRGDWMRFEAHFPDGEREILLNVPRYDFAWQALYRLAEPKRLPAGTRVVVSGGFDNTPWNPFNPNPAAVVRFGEQSWDEMFIGYLNYGEPR